MGNIKSPDTMHMHRFKFIAPLAIGILLAAEAIAQDDEAVANPANDGGFALFESLDGANNNASDAPGRNPNRGNSRATQAAPVFVLVGTSRIGNSQSALLKHLSGDVVRVPLSGSVNVIPGHELYSVVNHGVGQVAVRYPAAVLCSDFPDQGVSCDPDTNITSLSLTTANAVVVAEPEDVVEATEETPVTNPFEAIRDRGRAGDPNQPAQRFQPRRIPPEDVPPGYRVVSTPFGDRLVEQ